EHFGLIDIDGDALAGDAAAGRGAEAGREIIDARRQRDRAVDLDLLAIFAGVEVGPAGAASAIAALGHGLVDEGGGVGYAGIAPIGHVGKGLAGGRMIDLAIGAVGDGDAGPAIGGGGAGGLDAAGG